MQFDLFEDNPETPQPRRFRLNWIAVFLGAGTDVGVTHMLIWATIMSLASGLVIQEHVSEPAELAQEVQQSFEMPFTLGCLMLIGTLCTVLGGYVSAGLASRDYLRHAFATGLLVLVYQFYMDIRFPQQHEAWFQAFSHLVVIPAAMLGGWLRQPRSPRLPLTEDVGEHPSLFDPWRAE